MGKYNALQTHNLLLAKHYDENGFASNLSTLHQKDEARPKLARHHFEDIPKASDIHCRTQILDFWIGFLATSGASIVTLQNVLLTLAHPRCSCGSYHMKRSKSEHFEAAFIESLQTAKTCELSRLKEATKRADRGANVFVTQGSVKFFTSPQKLQHDHPSICLDDGRLDPKWIDMV